MYEIFLWVAVPPLLIGFIVHSIAEDISDERKRKKFLVWAFICFFLIILADVVMAVYSTRMTGWDGFGVYILGLWAMITGAGAALCVGIVYGIAAIINNIRDK